MTRRLLAAVVAVSIAAGVAAAAAVPDAPTPAVVVVGSTTAALAEVGVNPDDVTPPIPAAGFGKGIIYDTFHTITFPGGCVVRFKLLRAGKVPIGMRIESRNNLCRYVYVRIRAIGNTAATCNGPCWSIADYDHADSRSGRPRAVSSSLSLGQVMCFAHVYADSGGKDVDGVILPYGGRSFRVI